MRKKRYYKKTRALDKKFLFLVLILTGIGIFAILDSSGPVAAREFSDEFYFVRSQVIWASLGLLVMAIFSKVHFSFWKKISVPFFIINLALLFLVFIPGFGARLLGARRWILLGPVSIQPSEILKLSIACYFAKAAASEKKLLAYLFPIGLSVFLIMLQPDFGTALIITLIGFTQMFISGINLSAFFGVLLAGFISAVVLILGSSYRRDRLLTFLEQTHDPLGRSYHIRQVLLALGSGGFFGVGLGASRQKHLFLPETATDSVFAVIAEEVGFFGALLLIGLLAALIFRGMAIAKMAPDKFSKTLAAGIVAWIAGQTLINLGSMVALVPLTGVPLPFISYGGSSLIAILVGCGILLNISRNIHEEK